MTRTVPLDFSGTRITDNGYWTSSRAHLDIALSVGSRSRFGETTAFGRGAQFLRNQAGLALDRPARVVEMIGHSGMLDAVVQGNDGWVDIDGSMGFCPPGRVIASVSAGWASGDIQEYDDVELSRCIGHERG